jgi:hypothetical protein
MKSKKKKAEVYLIGLGSTAIDSGAYGGVGIYTLQAMLEKGKIDATVKNKQLDPGSAPVYILFLNVKAIDREIVRLKDIRADMKKTSFKAQIAKAKLDATNTKPMGNSHKRRKISRKD